MATSVQNRHPDANELSALLGGELHGAARRDLLAHLSRCAECRQWTGEAQSALATLVPAAPAPSAAPVRLWSRPRAWAPYALPAAAALALAGALWLRPALPVRAPAPAAAAPTSSAASHPAPVTPPRSAPAVAEPPSAPHAPAAFATLTGNGTGIGTGNGTGIADAGDVMVVPTSPARATAVATLAALPAPSAPSGEFQPSIDFSPLTTGFQDQPLEDAADIQFARQFLPQAASLRTTAALATPVAATAAAPAAPSLAPAARLARRLTGPYAPRIAPAPEGALGWTVSRGGAVLHSIGAGIWAAVPLVPGLHFRAVFASGSHIWAGADADQLFASMDRGAHWRRLPLPEPHPHAAHIESIEFSDSDHGMVRLDNGHIWVTSDGGTSWTSRP